MCSFYQVGKLNAPDVPVNVSIKVAFDENWKDHTLSAYHISACLIIHHVRAQFYLYIPECSSFVISFQYLLKRHIYSNYVYLRSAFVGGGNVRFYSSTKQLSCNWDRGRDRETQKPDELTGSQKCNFQPLLCLGGDIFM